MTTAIDDTSGPMSTSASRPPKVEGRALIVRVARTSLDQAIITEREGKREKLVMHVPFARVAARMRGQSVAFFTAEVDGESGVLELIEHSPPEKGWNVIGERAEPQTTASLSRYALGPYTGTLVGPERCPCGAPKHKEMCRDAIAYMNGRRSARWRAPGM